jgi:hypothetical protein
MRPLLESFFGYNQIKGKGEDAHKTTLITNWGIVNYECMLFVLPNASTTFKGHMKITLNELISIHIYLDDLIVGVVDDKNRNEDFARKVLLKPIIIS